MTLIGEHHPTRPTCATAGTCYPNCWNPDHGTWCQCGKTRWPRHVGTWHARPIYDGNPFGRGERTITGWDVYFLHTSDCGDRAVDGLPKITHLCGAA